MSDLIAEYKAMLMNADSLDIVYLSAESTDLYPSDGAELVSLTGVNSAGDVVLNLRFDVTSDRTGSQYHGIKKEDIAGLPFAVDVLAELKHFLTDDSIDRYCWSYWFIEFFDQLLDEKPAVNSVKDLICDSWLTQRVSVDEYSTLHYTAYALNVGTDDTSKEKLGFLLMQKSLELLPLAEEIAKLKNKIQVLENEVRIIIDPPKPCNQPVNNFQELKPIPKPEDDDSDIPF